MFELGIDINRERPRLWQILASKHLQPTNTKTLRLLLDGGANIKTRYDVKGRIIFSALKRDWHGALLDLIALSSI